MSDQHERRLPTRRLVLRGLVVGPAVGLAAGSSSPRAAQASLTASLDRYLAFLAREHLAVLVARWPELFAGRPDLAPMHWIPPDDDVDRVLGETGPECRAEPVLGIIGS